MPRRRETPEEREAREERDAWRAFELHRRMAERGADLRRRLELGDIEWEALREMYAEAGRPFGTWGLALWVEYAVAGETGATAN